MPVWGRVKLMDEGANKREKRVEILKGVLMTSTLFIRGSGRTICHISYIETFIQ